MADVELTVQHLSDDGITPTRNALSTENTYQVDNNGIVVLLVQKTGANDAVVEIQVPENRRGHGVSERSILVVATTGDVAAGPFDPAIFNSAAGQLEFTIDEDTSITCAVIEGVS